MTVCIPGYAATYLLYSVDRSFAYVVHSWSFFTLINRRSTCRHEFHSLSSLTLIVDHFNRLSFAIVDHYLPSSLTILDRRSPSSIVDYLPGSLLPSISSRILNLDHPICSRSWYLDNQSWYLDNRSYYHDNRSWYIDNRSWYTNIRSQLYAA